MFCLATENPVHRYNRFHTHTQAKDKLSLCTAIVTYALLCSYLPLRVDNTTILVQQNVEPPIEFQTPVFDQAKSFVWRDAALNALHHPTARELYTTLGSPLPLLL